MHRSRLLPFELALLVLCCPTSLSAQAPTERFVEEIEVRVINLDVVVTDRQGNALQELRREDFELLENGRPVPISYFSRIVEGRLEGEVGEEEIAPEIADREPRRMPVTWGIFVDQTHMRPARRNETLRRLRTFFEHAMDEGDRAILATFDGLAFRVRGNLSEDRDALLGRLGALEKERVSGQAAHNQELLLRTEIQRADDPVTQGRALADAIVALIDAEAARTSNAIAAMASLIDIMAGVEDRQALVYVGTGFNTLPAFGVTEAWRRRFPTLAGWVAAPRPEDHKFHLDRQVTDLYARMGASRMTLYSIFAGETGPGLAGIDDPGSIDMDAPPIVGEAAQLGEIASVRELAERTGGISFKTNADLARQMELVARDLAHYYSLGYVPQGPPGRERKLEVRVGIEGARVRHREQVRERTPDEQASDAVVAALFDPNESNPLGISIDVEPAQGRGRGRRIPVRIRVPLAALAFLPQDGTRRGTLTFHAAIAEPDGTVWRLESHDLPLEIPDGEFASALGKSITYGVEIPLRAEEMRLAISVQDRLAPQLQSILTIPLSTRSR